MNIQTYIPRQGRRSDRFPLIPNLTRNAGPSVQMPSNLSQNDFGSVITFHAIPCSAAATEPEPSQSGGIICPRRLPKRQPPFPNEGTGMSMTPMSCRIGHQPRPILYYTSCRCPWVNQSHVSLDVHSSVLRTNDTSETGRCRLTNMMSLSEYRV